MNNFQVIIKTLLCPPCLSKYCTVKFCDGVFLYEETFILRKVNQSFTSLTIAKSMIINYQICFSLVEALLKLIGLHTIAA